MSHAEAIHTLQPAAGATDRIVKFTEGAALRRVAGRSPALCAAAPARHRRRDDRRRARHIATQAENVIKAVRPAGKIPVPGRERRADLLDAAFLGGTAAHGIELDDGYRHGSAHCGCVVIPAALSVGYDRGLTGAR